MDIITTIKVIILAMLGRMLETIKSQDNPVLTKTMLQRPIAKKIDRYLPHKPRRARRRYAVRRALDMRLSTHQTARKQQAYFVERIKAA